MGAQGCSVGIACLLNLMKVSTLWWILSRSSISLIASHFETRERCMFSNFMLLMIWWVNLLCGQSHITFVHSLDPFFPWIVASEFNAIISLDVKRGRVAWLDPFSNMLKDDIDQTKGWPEKMGVNVHGTSTQEYDKITYCF